MLISARRSRKLRSIILAGLGLAGLLLDAGFDARAERFPVKIYTTADGLLRDQVNRIKQDSRGFLWFCTSDGLSRFDGYGFTNYTTDDGLPHRVVNDIVETRDGVIWIATNNGLARFNPRGRRGGSIATGNQQSSPGNENEPMFVTYRPEVSNSRCLRIEPTPSASNLETLLVTAGPDLSIVCKPALSPLCWWPWSRTSSVSEGQP